MAGIRTARAAIAFVCLGMGAGACTLLTDFGDLSGGPEGAADAKVDADAGASNDGPAAAEPSAYFTAVVADRPVGYWRLGERTGSVARDQTGAHDGVFAGSMELGIPGALPHDTDTAVHSDGTSAYVDVGDQYDFVGSGLSIEIWFQADAFAAGGKYNERYAVSKLESGKAGYHLYVSAPYVHDGGVAPALIAFDVCDVKGCDTVGFEVSLPTSFVHVVAVDDLSNVILYVDGVERSRKANTRLVSDTSTSFQIGRGDFFDGGFFPGKMDEVAAYDHALPLTRVQAHYAAR